MQIQHPLLSSTLMQPVDILRDNRKNLAALLEFD